MQQKTLTVYLLDLCYAYLASIGFEHSLSHIWLVYYGRCFTCLKLLYALVETTCNCTSYATAVDKLS